jgi:hypothetical protein
MFNQKPVDKKLVIKLSFLGLVVIFLLCILQILDYSLVHPITISEISSSDQVEWQIDQIKVDTHYVAISGWAFTPGQEPANFAIRVILKNDSTNEAVEIPTTMVVKEKINENYDEEIDYSHSGFLSRVNKSFLDLNQNAYTIYLEFISQNQHLFINTNQVLNSRGD